MALSLLRRIVPRKGRRLISRVLSFLKAILQESRSFILSSLSSIKPFNWYLNGLIWSPHVVFLFFLAVYSRLRYYRLFRTNWKEKLTFFDAATGWMCCSLDALLQKSLEGQLFIEHKEFVKSPVLDIGTGDGSLAVWFQPFLGKIDAGIDAMRSQAVAAKAQGAYREVVVAMAENIPYRDSCFETVISVCVMEHVKGIERAFEEITRVLKPGGYLLMTVISEQHDQGLLIPYMFRVIGMEKAARKYTDWFNGINFHHRPTFGLPDYKKLLADRYDFIHTRHFWSIANRRLYDVIGWPHILIGYKFGNIPIVYHLIRNSILRPLAEETREWLLVPRLLLDDEHSEVDYTHLFMVLREKESGNYA
jgi:ubiquinone/menaquinone biosynthesis C-methylase UbiE